MMVEQAAILPNPDEIRRDLEYMVARWGELAAPAVFELRAFKEGATPQTAKFAPDWIDEAVEWAENMNELGFNIYAVRNPIRADVSGSAKDTDIIASFFLWADCDDPASAGNVHRFDGPKWSAAVITGTKPAVRVHTYWQLQAPCTDMAEWRAMQETIAAHFGSDRSVVNPSRIMRVGGTVAYPAKHKQERGYVKELTKIRTQYDEERKPVSLDQMRRVFGSTAPAQAATDTFKVDIGPQPLDRERTAIQALAGQEWNNAVLRLVGSYVRKGLSDDEIHALTDPLTLAGYTVQDTRREVQDMIDRTRRNPKFEGAGQDDKAPDIIIPKRPINILSSDQFVGSMQPPVYIIDGILQQGRAHSLTGYTGHGKTTLAMHLMLCVALGEDFCGAECEAGATLFIAGENPDNVKYQYAAAIAAIEKKPAEVPAYFLPGHFQMSAQEDELHQQAAQIPNLRLIIIDSLQSFFEGDSDNSNVEMIQAAQRFRRLAENLPSKPAVIVIAHPAGKKADKTNLLPRGGSSFTNELDGNFTVWAEPDGTQVMHWEGKHRGPPFEPLNLMMVDCQFDHITDHKGRAMPLKYTRQQLIIEQANAARRAEDRDREALMILDAEPRTAIRALAEALHVSRSTAQRTIDTLKAEKLIRRKQKGWHLTDDGKAFLTHE